MLARSPAPLLLLVAATGCVALPIATPPLQLAVAGGARSLRSDSIDDFDAPVQVRAAVHPLQLFPRLMNRVADVGVGYLLDYGANASVNGGYLEASVNALRSELGGGLGRLSVGGQLRLIKVDPEDAWGQSVALHLAWEYSSFTDSDFSNATSKGGSFGHSYGEVGIGVFLEGAWLRAGTLQGWTATAGLVVRIPAAYGIAYAWIWELL